MGSSNSVGFRKVKVLNHNMVSEKVVSYLLVISHTERKAKNNKLGVILMPLDKKFKCREHYYSCNTIPVWEWHLTDEVHTHTGNIRGEDFTFTGKIPKNTTSYKFFKRCFDESM